MRHPPAVCGCSTRSHLAERLGDGSPALKSLNMGSQLCFKVRILDQIAIKSTLDRQHIYLVNVWIVRYVVLGTSPWHGTCRSRAGQHGYPFSGYIRSVLDRRGTARRKMIRVGEVTKVL